MGMSADELQERVEGLLARLQQGRQAAEDLLALVDEYRAYLLGIGDRVVQSHGPATDGASGVFHDSWIRIRGNLHRFEGTKEKQFKRWLRVIYIRQLKQRIAELRREHKAVTDMMSASCIVASPSESAQKAEADRSAERALEHYLRNLRPKDRVVFVLREGYGFTDAAIARVLGNTADAVRKRRHKLGLRRHLAKAGESVA